ncbi:MAG: hypothetical protein BWY69_01624 [Planctomycetes bacterium ADurb.Bin401]|nr:MAG: hypothetical protein BWY69_01624 [Planctomycetes bacterium ADurb.Bin401]
MKKTLEICLILIAASTTYAATIQSITANNAVTNFNHTNGLFEMTGTGGLVIYESGNVALSGTFTLNLFLQNVPAGTTATANLKPSTTGSFAFTDGSTNYLSGTITSFNIVEVFNGGGMLAGIGAFTVSPGSSLVTDFGSIGDIVNITFFVPSGIDDFTSTSFTTAASNFTVNSIPEPATIAMLSLGALSVFRKRIAK